MAVAMAVGATLNAVLMRVLWMADGAGFACLAPCKRITALPCRAGQASSTLGRLPRRQGGDSLAWGQTRKTSAICHPQKSHQQRIEGCANGHRHGHDTAMTPLTPLGLHKRSA